MDDRSCWNGNTASGENMFVIKKNNISIDLITSIIEKDGKNLILDCVTDSFFFFISIND